MRIPIGLHLTNFGFPGISEAERFNHAVAIAQAAEAAGFDTLWVNDHLIEAHPPNQGGFRPETYLYLATVAARTSRIRLGALASSIFFRTPALLARMVRTLDEASNGRAILGVGAGHPMTEDEHRKLGMDFPPIRIRMDRLEEALPEIRRLIGEGIPIMVAGSGEHRLLRIVARHADLCNLSMPSGDSLDMVRHKLGVLRAHCAAVGRDPSSITTTYKAVLSINGSGNVDFAGGLLSGDPHHVLAGAQSFVDAGIDQMIVQMPDVHDLSAIMLAATTLADMRPRSPSRGRAVATSNDAER